VRVGVCGLCAGLSCFLLHAFSQHASSSALVLLLGRAVEPGSRAQVNCRQDTGQTQPTCNLPPWVCCRCGQKS
jgi:hypothetical protein